MLTCPMCRTELAEPAPRCPRCQTDLSLLADFVTDLATLLQKADGHRKAGELAAAVQAYLAVLDVDPANAVARSAIGPALLAVRTAGRAEPPRPIGSAIIVIALLAVAAAFTAGLCLGRFVGL
jgi:predicted TPR repeat methyltransferase